MAVEDSLELLSLPAATLDGLAGPTVRDAVEYFTPDAVAIPGPRTVVGYASVRDVAPDRPVIHPQLGGGDGPIRHVRYSEEGEVRGATDGSPPAGTVDVIAVQSREVLPRLRTQLATEERRTGGDAATFVIVPELAVDWDATALSASLPAEDVLGAIREVLSEPVTVLAGGQPAEYYHEWPLPADATSESIPIAGLGATERGGPQLARYTCTAGGSVAAEAVDADQFGLGALQGVGRETAERLRDRGCRTTSDVRDVAASDLADLPGLGEATAKRIHAHAAVIDSGEPLVLTNETPVKTRDGRPPVCLDVETDGLSPTIIWQFGLYDPATDEHRAFLERDRPNDPEPVLEAFLSWFLPNHGDRTVLTWNGQAFDYRQISRFTERYCPEYAEAWDDVWTSDLYRWAVRDGNALLPGRTNRLDHVARALGYDSAATGLTGAQTAAAYQEFMRNPDDPASEPEWGRHEIYCEDDCRALWHVYRAIRDADRRDTTDSGAGGAGGRQAGLTDFTHE